MGGAGQVREPRGGPYPPRPPTQTTQHREKAGLCTPGHTSLPPAWHDTGWSLPCVSAFLIFTEVGDSKGRSLVGPCTEPRAPSWMHRLPIQVHPFPVDRAGRCPWVGSPRASVRVVRVPLLLWQHRGGLYQVPESTGTGKTGSNRLEGSDERGQN